MTFLQNPFLILFQFFDAASCPRFLILPVSLFREYLPYPFLFIPSKSLFPSLCLRPLFFFLYSTILLLSFPFKPSLSVSYPFSIPFCRFPSIIPPLFPDPHYCNSPPSDLPSFQLFPLVFLALLHHLRYESGQDKTFTKFPN